MRKGIMEMADGVIWFVEDDENDVLLINRALREAGMLVTTRFASNAEQVKAMFVVASAASMLPDIIVTDLKLVGEDGFSVMAWIKSQPSLKFIPLVVLTSSMLEEDRQKAMALGATSFVSKSCGGRKLARLLGETLGPLLKKNSMSVRRDENPAVPARHQGLEQLRKASHDVSGRRSDL